MKLLANSEPTSSGEPAGHRRLGIYGGLALGLWVLLCWGFSLGLPFFFDDLPIMSWVMGHNWRDMALSHEGGYYRPLAFLVYKLGEQLPVGARQPALHAVNLLLLWASALLIVKIVHLCDDDLARGYLAALLFVAFPFLCQAIPWVTALPHPLVTALTLLAVCSVLLAEREQRPRYWALSLGATALAPLAHENGAVTGLIVAGVVLVQHGLRPAGRRWAILAAGVALNAAVVASRWLMPGVDSLGSGTAGSDLPQNLVAFLQALAYPLAPAVEWAVQRWGWRDLTLVGLLGAALILLLGAVALKTRRWRWIARGLGWWAVGALPAAISLEFGTLYISPRLYTFVAPAIAMLWAGLLSELAPGRWLLRWRQLLAAGLAAALLVQNLAYLGRQRALYDALNGLYAETLELVDEGSRGPFAFVNLPAALIWEDKTYPLTTDDVMFVPYAYSNLMEFVAVNLGRREVQAAACGLVFQETNPLWVAQGPWLEGGAMRDFLAAHAGCWLGRYQEETGLWHLQEAGAVRPSAPAPAQALARFEGGPTLVAAAIEPGQGDGEWRLVLDWWAETVAEAAVFVHVLDAAGQMAAQADGPAVGGTLPLAAWQAGDSVRDVRHLSLPAGAKGPFTVLVGVYSGNARFPALAGETRFPNDAVPVGAIAP